MINKFIKQQFSLSEFDFNIVHVLNKNLEIINELSKIVNAFSVVSFAIENLLTSFAIKNVKVITNILISKKDLNLNYINSR